MMNPQDQESDANPIEKAPLWMVSLGDVTALMLAFFVMLFAMSNPQTEKWKDVVALINTSTDKVKDPNPTSELNIGTVDLIGGLSPVYLNRILKDKLSKDDVLSQAIVTGLDERVFISLPSDLIFIPNSADIETGASESIRRLAGVLNQFGNQVDVVGHTDPDPITNDKYPSNWDLSLARALTMANALNHFGYVGKFTVLGLADSRYKFLDKRLPEEKRYKLARRIDLVILPVAGGQP